MGKKYGMQGLRCRYTSNSHQQPQPSAPSTASTPGPFYVVKQEAGDLFLNNLTLHDKSEEDVSSAGEQLTSNRIYDGENTNESFLLKRLFFIDFIVTYGSINSSLDFLFDISMN